MITGPDTRRSEGAERGPASGEAAIIRGKTLTDQAYELLRRQILEGNLAPGERVTEVALAKRFGVSRTPVRQALARLRVDGLIEAGDGNELRVIEPQWEDFEAYQLCRAALEELVARLAAERATEQDIATMRQALAVARECAERGDVVGLLRANTDFHETMVLSTRNRPLRNLMDSIRGPILVFRSAILHYSAEEREIVREHETILDAIAARDPEQAASLIREHLQSDRKRGRRAIERLKGVPGGSGSE